jgi:hypothetical protein
MVDQQLIDYISENLKNGFPPGEIRTQVIKYGWSEQDADSAMGIAMADLQWTPPKRPDEVMPAAKGSGRKSRKKLIILLAAVLAAIVTVFTLSLMGMIPGINIIQMLPFGAQSSQARFSALGVSSSHALKSNGLLRLNIPNSLSDTIEVSSVSVSTMNGDSNCNVYMVPTTIYSGSSKDISIDCTSLGYATGQSYSLMASVTYRTEGGYDTVDTAAISGLVSSS